MYIKGKTDQKHSILIILVVKSFNKLWLPTISDALKNRMNTMFKILNFKDVSPKIFNCDIF